MVVGSRWVWEVSAGILETSWFGVYIQGGEGPGAGQDGLGEPPGPPRSICLSASCLAVSGSLHMAVSPLPSGSVSLSLSFIRFY